MAQDDIELVDVIFASVAMRVAEERSIAPADAVARVLEHRDERVARAMIRMGIRTWQTFAAGENRDADLQELEELIEAEVLDELAKGWRDPG